MLLLKNTDKLQLVSSAAASLDVHCSFMDHTTSNDDVVGDRQNTAITTATTTDIVATPSAGVIRNVKTVNIRNKHASLACDVTVVYDANATDFELHKATIDPGETLEYVEGLGWFLVETVARLDKLFVTTADVTNATTSFIDITDLTCPVKAGKTYDIEARLVHINNATTTGSRFGFNGPAMTYVIASTIDTVTGSVTASVHSAGTVTALETAITAQTTGSAANTLAVISGSITPSADGTFAMRCASEVAVASGLIVRRGSCLHIREADNT